MRSSARPPRPNSAQRAYDFAKWAILNGVYHAGSRLTVSALARELGVGQSPAREALLRLEAEGLVTVEPGRGGVVRTFSPGQVEDVLEARSFIENSTARRSFQNREKFLPTLLEAHEEAKRRRRSRDAAGFTAADRRFHEVIVEGAENAVLSAMYRSLLERQALFTSTVVRGRVDRMDASIADHERIVACLQRHDEDTFLGEVNRHLGWSTALARTAY